MPASAGIRTLPERASRAGATAVAAPDDQHRNDRDEVARQDRVQPAEREDERYRDLRGCKKAYDHGHLAVAGGDCNSRPRWPW
jgi:hypothetical protein